MNECSACGQDFGSLSAFDAHRVGRFDHPWSPAHPDGRRCLSSIELHERGLRQDIRGRWRLPQRGTPPWKTDVTPQEPADEGVQPETQPEPPDALEAIHQGSDDPLGTSVPVPTGMGIRS